MHPMHPMDFSWCNQIQLTKCFYNQNGRKWHLLLSWVVTFLFQFLPIVLPHLQNLTDLLQATSFHLEFPCQPFEQSNLSNFHIGSSVVPAILVSILISPGSFTILYKDWHPFSKSVIFHTDSNVWAHNLLEIVNMIPLYFCTPYDYSTYCALLE